MSTAIRLKDLREQRAGIVAELRRLGDVVRKEERDLSAEEREKFDRLKADFTATGDQLRAVEKELGESGAGLDALLRGTYDPTGRLTRGGRTDDLNTEERALAFQGWVFSQYGLPLSDEHLRAAKKCGVNPQARDWVVRLGTGAAQYRSQSTSNTEGGYTIREDFSGVLERTMKAFGGVRNVATVRRSPEGAVMNWPTVDDTSNTGALLAENAEVTDLDVVFGVKSFTPIKITSKMVKASYELLQDSALDLASELGLILGERIGRSEGAYHTTGTGTSQPQGAVTGATAGITAAGASAIVATEIVRLKHSVDPAYRSGPSFGFMMHDGILAALAILQDANDQPLFTPSYRDGVDKLAGLPVFVNQHMQSTIATGTVTVLCGDFSKYVIRDVDPGVRLRRLDERYAEFDQTGFVAFLRSDARYVNTAAVKKLTQA